MTYTSQTTNALGAGNLQARIHLDYEDELGNLAQAFNHMAGQISGASVALTGPVPESPSRRGGVRRCVPLLSATRR